MWGLLALSGKASVLPASTIYQDKCFPHAHPHLSSVTGRPWHSLMVSSLWALGAGKGRRGEISQDLRMIQPSSVPQTPAPLPQPHGFCAWYRERQCFVNDGEKNLFFCYFFQIWEPALSWHLLPFTPACLWQLQADSPTSHRLSCPPWKRWQMILWVCYVAGVQMDACSQKNWKK